MASQDEANSFEAIIHADRQRKKNEDLANQIFRRSKSKPQGEKKQKEKTPSLASRMGVQKRSSSSSTPTQKNPFNPPSRPSSTTPSHRNNPPSAARASRIASEIDSGNSTNMNLSSPRNTSYRNGTASTGFTIKGSAGPFTLLASNFAPGTTEADIEAALHTELFDDAGNNCLQSCQIVSNRPSVAAEMVFTEKSVADRIVSKFNNLKADGRILKVSLSKSGPESSASLRRSAGDRDRGNSAIAQTIEPVNAVSDNIAGTVGMSGEGDMEVDDAEITAEYPASSSYDHDREAADRDRRDRDRDRDGYGSSQRDDDRREPERPRDDRDRRRDDRDRDREGDRDRDRDRDRERERERDRNREYDRRNSYDSRQQRPPAPAYGDGFNGPFPRGGYGGYGGRGGGYGYPRGGYGPRGGYRGGYMR